MRFTTLCLILLTLTAACRKQEQPDAYGNVEATEVVVGAEAAGRIEALRVHEGDKLLAGAVVGTIETTRLGLQEKEISSQRDVSASRINEVEQQIGALSVQRAIARRAYERTRRLFAKHAATAPQLDQAERDYKVLGEQIDAARAQQESIRREMQVTEARLSQVSEQVGNGTITNPIDGTVLATYAKAGEVTQNGAPLYRIADLRSVEVRAYVTETQLASVRVGQAARVTVDTGEKQRSSIDGTVTWVSSDAEFTPTPIQTREERADLVYAVKIRVANPNGLLKIGMPADVDFPSQVAGK
ncbi:MAG TPA: HlyD family efflux transporter periplasmic adaptor subunit [Thermoanaerobaculia bacterium]|nr:HlyD family efflux transporter periplasmic adaptor subunit [Thermoanaerobaculia bacterium]